LLLEAAPLDYRSVTSVNNPSADTLRFFKCQHLSDRKYLIENDKIVAQTIHYTVEQKK
jgi:hypothetical protein